MPFLESEAARLTADMSRPAIASEYSRLAEVTQKLAETEARIKSLYQEWEEAANQIS